ncbi:4Fe-4S ferredoxin iron-sulfur binding domain protein [Chloroherpeton thalassium ATCC 35110]|uniref:4Fe-4S ferredoxin iron-sulfur binding domain protein n=1 Tax=Chloroherpeton thalassium (strain ATCC 35110 / GB-78) TaxID=517418 RepID=B3QUL5_CHLT3|nr:YfhL family 4Fe-4S dicluster ferredoxin [Chloroherpeton thalassium]ACF12921.1 4Fe-4S ferredoxin iron-sulfur binding domain protein [Chloroherpeton thalassium ATCC 35110]
MALYITEDCISCGVCVDECPNNAIDYAESGYAINPDLCTECVGDFDAPQCMENCPSEAIQPDPNYQESKEDLLAKKERISG